MSETLYLDTARLGLMCPSAQRIQNAFARFAGDPNSLLYFEEFLRRGYRGLPGELREEYPELSAWRGVEGLSESVLRLTKAAPDSEVFLASRSAGLMRLAAEQLAERCQSVVTVDLLWSPYRRLLVDTCRRRGGRQVTVCRLRSAALGGCEPQELVSRLLDVCRSSRDNGLVLPLLDHRGIGLPVQQVVTELKTRGRPPRFVVVDGTQALGHLPVDTAGLGCDFLIGGAHKWVGGYHPLGVGVVSQNAAASMPKPQLTADPLLRLTQEKTGRLSARHGETAALLPLLTAAAALADLEESGVQSGLSQRLENRAMLYDQLAASPGWRPRGRRDEAHGIVLARPPRDLAIGPLADGACLLKKAGVVATGYRNGLVRFSLPSEPLTADERLRLHSVLGGVRSGDAPLSTPIAAHRTPAPRRSNSSTKLMSGVADDSEGCFAESSSW